MGTNYYVDAPACDNACEHCTAVEPLHLGKSNSGWRFAFKAEPDWPRNEAFAHWIRRALSGPIRDEYGNEITLAELMKIVDDKATGTSHIGARPGSHYDFQCCGHDFIASQFS